MQGPRAISPVLVLLLASACSAAPAPLPGGPAPEYEAPRPFPLATASASVTAPPPAPPAPFGSAEKLGAEIDAYMAGFGARYGEAYAPSGVVVVAHHGVPVVVRSFGKTERGKAEAPTLSTRFRVGSLTKQFTAAATLKLASAGAVKLDESVRAYVPELPESYAPVLVVNLLQQTSGIPSYTDDPAMLARSVEKVPSSDVVAWLSKHPPTFEAGSKWEYSNSNYYLLSLVVERKAGMPYETFLAKEILAPAGMKTASTSIAAPGTAVGYMRNASDALEPARLVDPSVPFGAGSLVASANDLLAWDRALVGEAVLSEASKKTMWSVGRDNYAMGWLVMPIEGTPVEWHNGAIDGFGSFFARAPERDLAVVLLSNVFDFDATKSGMAVLSMALGGAPVPPEVERPMVAVDEAFAKSVTGDYVVAKASREALEKKLPAPVLESIEGFTLGWEAGHLTGHPSGQGTFGLRKSPEGVLFNASLGVEMTLDFGKKPEKTAKGFSLAQHGLTVEYVRGKLKAKPKKAGAGAADVKKPEKKAEPKKGDGTAKAEPKKGDGAKPAPKPKK
jgi:CubicO group peptidase (beta-lactamase class C family)